MYLDDAQRHRPPTKTNPGNFAATANMNKEPPDKTADSIRKNKLQKGSFLSGLHDRWDLVPDLPLAPDSLPALIVPDILSQLANNAEKDVQAFLEKDPKFKMDDCVRWYLLLHAVNLNKAKDEKQKVLLGRLSDIIIGGWPYLAFEYPYDQAESAKAYVGACVDKKGHDCKCKETPFHVAAKSGNDKAIESMINHGDRYYGVAQGGRARHPPSEWPLVRVMQQTDPATNETALMLAAKGGKECKETLRKLLRVEGIAVLQPDPESPGDSALQGDPFDHALRAGLPHVVEELLGTQSLRRHFVTRKAIVRALEKLDKPVQGQNQDSKATRVMIAKSLASAVEDEGIVDRRVAEMIIAKGEMDIWKALPSKSLGGDLKSYLLHLAVIHQKLAFVKIFVDYPGSVSKRWAASEDKTAQFALWYNNNPPSRARDDQPQPPAIPSPEDCAKADRAGEIKADIRKAIVTKMIHEISEMERLSDIFYDSEENVGDVCFDMSRFNSELHQLSEFVESLVRENSTQKLFSYESTLRYAEFPPLNVRGEEREAFRDNCYLQRQHTEVFEVFKWLRGKDVDTIIELRVPDRLINPHDDRKMAKEVDRLKVEVLDWRVLDLCISVLHEDTRNRLTKLHLYSSGRRAVIDHWFSAEGVMSLKKLNTLKISVVQETCTMDRANELTEDIKNRLKGLKKRLKDPDKISEGRPREIHVEAKCVTWSPVPTMADLNMVAHRVAPKLAQWTKGLDSHIKQVTADPWSPPHRKTRVAILDNGILSISPKLSNSAGKRAAKAGKGPQPQASGGGGQSGQRGVEEGDQYDDNRSLLKRIKAGRSFVDATDRLSPWLFASNPHGTQMANLICAIDPCCEIYVARVAEDEHGITPKRIEKAIAWARSMKVDVISMSFFIGEQSAGLQKEIERATGEGIVMTCSTHDEGSRVEKAFPAGYKRNDLSLIVLAACDEYGRVLLDVKKDDYHYVLPGKKVVAGTIPFLDSEETLTGSSVATALAAGVCSLTLTCDRFANPGRTYVKGKDDPVPDVRAKSRWNLVTDELDRMASGDDKKFVLLDKFGGIAKRATGNSGVPSTETILGNF